MLRQRVKVKESDRFIAARSSEREMMIERYKIKDSKQFENNKKQDMPIKIARSASPILKTPLIIKDKKQISEKLYLSLLKTQLFKKKQLTLTQGRETSKRITFSSKKRRRDSLSSLNSCPVKKENLIENNSNQQETPERINLSQKEETPISFNCNVNNSYYNTNFNCLNKSSLPFNTPQRDIVRRHLFNNTPSESGSQSNLLNKLFNLNNFHSNLVSPLYYSYNIKSFPKPQFQSAQMNKRQKLDSDYVIKGFDNNNFLINFIDFSFPKEDEVNTKYFNGLNLTKPAYKVLDAPGLKDDFYLHLLDWSDNDFLAVGLESSVYLWEHETGSVTLFKNFPNEKVTSVKWLNSHLITIGLNSGKVIIQDIQKNKTLWTLSSHKERVGVISYVPGNTNLFTSGSLDCEIINYDIRQQEVVTKFLGHSAEICGLEWSRDGKTLASGGNDNKLMLWTLRKSKCEKNFAHHKSAVKALSWSFNKYGLLASGGGTQDRTIKFWNSNTHTLLENIETESQVCNLAFSKISNQFVSTHGYSDNLILVWDYERLDVISIFKGHRDRVIYMSTSPDGKKIVTGAGDETVRFWNVFDYNSIERNSPKLKTEKFIIR
jgi:WD40 repeat protein